MKLKKGISIHAPRAGRDDLTGDTIAPEDLFQSTRPVRGATQRLENAAQYNGFQSTRPVRGATIKNEAEFRKQIFQSTRPVRGATQRIVIHI